VLMTTMLMMMMMMMMMVLFKVTHEMLSNLTLLQQQLSYD